MHKLEQMKLNHGLWAFNASEPENTLRESRELYSS